MLGVAYSELKELENCIGDVWNVNEEGEAVIQIRSAIESL
jgi:hypothetical protein